MTDATEPRIALIQRVVCDHFGITPRAMLSDLRARKVSRPRQVAMYLARSMTARSLPQIGAAFARDHTTIIHAIGVIEQLMATKPGFAAEVHACRLRVSDHVDDDPRQMALGLGPALASVHPQVPQADPVHTASMQSLSAGFGD